MKTEARLAIVRQALTDALDAIGRGNELKGRATFTVFAEDSNPHETGPMTVVMTEEGIVASWEGCEDDPWEISWRALREMCDANGELEWLQERIAEERKNLAELRGEGTVVGAIAPGGAAHA